MRTLCGKSRAALESCAGRETCQAARANPYWAIAATLARETPMDRPPRSTLAPSLALLTTLGAAGCLPIPHTVTLAPAIDGRFVDEGGRPVAGARMALSTQSGDSTCARPASTTTTDAEGRFAFAAIRQRERWLLLIGDTFYPYRLCAGTSERFRLGDERLHGALSPAEASLECRLAVMSPLRTAPLECFNRPRAPAVDRPR